MNHTLAWLSVTFFVVIGIWAAIFYFNMLDEIYDSIDDGLENSKILIIQQSETDSTIIHKTNFLESNYAIHEITAQRALNYKDIYLDSTIYTLNEEDYEPVRMIKSSFRAKNGKYFELEVISSMVEEDDLIEDLAYSILWLYVILVATILIINNILLRKVWKPFYQVLDRLRRFNVESPENSAPEKTTVTEFQMLNESVNALLARTATTFNSQKQFIENASHELQTPLAISINKLELLAEKETLAETDLKEVSTVIQSLQRLTRLNKTLLLLSKIENKQFPDSTRVDIDDIADNVVDELSDFAEFKTVNIETIHEEKLTLNMNAELASIMLSNLVKNAIIHNRKDGSVTIRINTNSIIVANTSDANALDSGEIFKRFYKNTSSNTSTGLGLAIVKSIADNYGYAVQYNFNGQHNFTIKVS